VPDGKLLLVGRPLEDLPWLYGNQIIGGAGVPLLRTRFLSAAAPVILGMDDPLLSA